MSPLDRAWRGFLYRAIFPTVFPQPRRIPFAEVKRLLIIRSDAIGDMILTTPLIHVLHKQNPSMKICVAASDRNADVISRDPAVDSVVILVQKGAIRHEAIRELRDGAFQLVLQCVTNSTTKYGLLARWIAPHAVTAALAHAERPEYAGLFTMLVEVQNLYARPYAEIMLEFARQVCGLHITDDDLAPRIVRESAAEHAADEFLGERVIAYGTAVLVNLSAAQLRKRWPLERYDRLIGMMEADGIQVVLSAVGSDRSLAGIVSQNHRATLYPAPTIRHIAAMAARCGQIITPDTAMVHVASATGTPVVALYSDANSVVPQWLPYRVPYRAVRTDKNDVSAITPDEVFIALKDLRSAVPSIVH